MPKVRERSAGVRRGEPPAACGLCGKRGKLTVTECCGRPVCDDEDAYVLFSYARNSCSRNHRRFTLCGFHHSEGHRSGWKTCATCRTGFEPEMVAWYGTNEYNFEPMPDPPAFEPTLCAGCRVRIHLGTDGYVVDAQGYWCEACSRPGATFGGRARSGRVKGRRGRRA